MTSAEFSEINFHIDGELGAEEAAEIEALLERDLRRRALFHALWRQKADLAQALRTLEAACARNVQTSRLLTQLADAMAGRIAPPCGSPPGRAAPTRTWTDD